MLGFARVAIIAALVATATGSQAVQRISLHLQKVQGPAGVVAENVDLQLDISGARPVGVLSIARLQTPAMDQPLRNLRLRCPAMRLTSLHIACPDGRLQMSAPGLAQSELPVAFDYRVAEPRLQLQLPHTVWTFNSADGNYAAEGLALSLAITLTQNDASWHFQGSLKADAGQAYADPVFLDFGATPTQLEFAGDADFAGQRFEVSAFQLDQPGVLAANGRLLWAQDGIENLAVTVDRATLPAAFQTYAQPFLIGTSFAALSTSGVMRAEIKRDSAGWSAISVTGDRIDVADDNNRLQVNGGALDAHWQRDTGIAAAPVSRLSWDAASVYKIALGATDLSWQMAGDDLALAGPAVVPVFNGRLEVDHAAAQDLTSDNTKIDFQARLTPVRLAQLSNAFGWPEFGGEVSGTLPALLYRNGEIILTGGLQARVFDGQVQLNNLSIANPLGARPRLRADVLAHNLDLEQVSSAFSFGRITGRLDADVTELRMLAWLPVAFKAWLRTSENDRSRHRISQRAIDNLASLGGGPTGLVSRGFLGFFDDFAYDRIGLGCVLSQGVCSMRGLAPADNDGYIIVRGNWLPRIDVVGYNRRVSWPVLLEQLKSVTAGQAPVINPDNPAAVQ